MTATNQSPENDSLKVKYDEETGEIQLEWDPQDTYWNWLADLTAEEIRDMIMRNAQRTLDEFKNETENI